MKHIFITLVLILILQNVYADDFWINPEWETSKSAIEKKYKLKDIEIYNLMPHLDNYFSNEISKKFKTYLVDKKYSYGDKEFNIIIGFYSDKLQWIMIATDELDKKVISKNEILDIYPKLFNVDKLLTKGDAAHNLMKEFCVVSGNVRNNIYYEIQVTLNRNYEQFTYFQMNHIFFENLKVMTKKSLQFNEHVITRLMPREKE